MKKFALASVLALSLGLVAQAGPESISGKEMKQVVPVPCDEWYRDTEWNVSLWGTYVFTAENWDEDQYIESDHGWGGGMDLKFFFHRYFGIGIEGWVIDAQREQFLGVDFVNVGGGMIRVVDVFDHDDRLIGGIKGTFTIRFPLHCSRFAPYLFAGGGAIFGGGDSETISVAAGGVGAVDQLATHHDGDPEFYGQVGAGFEVRLTRHIGFINDFSWNFVARENSDFGMLRSGINFAF